MKKEALTAKQIEHMKADPERRIEVPAGPPTGLYLVVQKSGSKGWAFRYNFRGRSRKLTFPKGYPEWGLAAARAEAEAKVADLDRDVDPAVSQAEEEKIDAPDSAKVVAAEWITRYVKPNTQTWREVERILNRDVLPVWRDKFMHEIQRPDVLRLIDTITDSKRPVLANRTLSILKRWFRWSVERGYISASPAAEVRPPSKEATRERVLTPDETVAIWTAAPDLDYPFGPYFRLLMLTGQRRSEVAKLRWEHVDLDSQLWTLPREDTKAGRAHEVHLSDAAVELLGNLPRYAGHFVFSTTSGKRPISGFSKAKVMLDKAVVKRRKEDARKAGLNPADTEGLAEWHLHDVRRTLTTWMADNGVAPHVLASILNHSPGSTMGITAVYARSKWSKEKRSAMQLWSEYVVGSESKPVVAVAS